MSYGFVEPGTHLLGEITQERITIADLQHQGHYADAGQLADDLLRRLVEWLPAPDAAEVDLGQAPHVLQGVALLADSSFSSLAAGDNDGAAERLRLLGHFSQQLGGLADRIAGMGLQYCKDGRPSLDGTCLKAPPCA
jgi:hypothetical protein